MATYALAPVRDGRADWSSAVGVATAPITRRQQRVLCCIEAHITCRGYPPTLQHIATQVGLASTNTVMHHVRRLAAAGLLQWCPRRPRALAVTAGRIVDRGTPSTPGGAS